MVTKDSSGAADCEGHMPLNEVSSATTDSSGLVYAAFVFFGATALFSYNAFLSTPTYSKDFYKYAANNPNATTAMPGVWANIENYISVASMLPNMIGQLSLLTPPLRKIPLYAKMLVGTGLMLVSNVAILVTPIVGVDDEIVSLAILLTAVAVTNVAVAFYQGTFLGIGALLPARYTQGYVLGNSVSGTVVSVIALVIEAATSHSSADYFGNHVRAGRVYFAVSALWVFLSLLFLFPLRRSLFLKQFVTEWQHEEDHGEDEGEAAKWLLEQNQQPPAPTTCPRGWGACDPFAGDPMCQGADGGCALVVSQRSALKRAPIMAGKVDLLAVMRAVGPMIYAVVAVFTVTLLVFPRWGIIPHQDGTYYPLWIILCFNLGDLFGRMIARCEATWLRRSWVPHAATARVLLIACFLACVRPTQLITSVWFPLTAMLVTGVTNGFVAAMAFIHAPTSEALQGDDGMKAMAGTVMALSLATGCTLGSVLATVIVPYV